MKQLITAQPMKERNDMLNSPWLLPVTYYSPLEKNCNDYINLGERHKCSGRQCGTQVQPFHQVTQAILANNIHIHSKH